MELLVFLLLMTWLVGAQGKEATLPTFYPCPFLGAAFSKPDGIGKDDTIKRATENLTATFKAGLTTGLLDNETTAFSITLFSVSDEENNPFYAFHQTPPSLKMMSRGVKEITSDSVYRLGSVSKLYTVYSLLVADGFKNFYAPITDFIPELLNDTNGNSTSTKWEEITLQALASHLGGIGAEYGQLDIATSPFPYTSLGLPEPPENEIPSCGGPLKTPLCNRQQFLHGMRDKAPVFPAYYSPAYSNAGLAVLGYAIETITETTFQNILETKVFNALNLSHSFYEKPDDSLGVIPIDSQDLFWNTSVGVMTPSFGLYASPRDLAAFGRAILSSQQLSSTETNRWLKPVSHTTDASFSVGAPWEITRMTLPTSPYRTVDLYTKPGSIGFYTSFLVLIPDYDVGFTVNVAGPRGAVDLLTNTVATTLVPALEEAARKQTDEKTSGIYAAKDGQYSFTLSTTPDAPGIHLTNFTGPDDSDFFATLGLLSFVAAGHYKTASQYLPYFQNGSATEAYRSGLFGVEIDLRLYPTMLEDLAPRQAPSGSKKTYRAGVVLSSSSSGTTGPFITPCNAWSTIDAVELGVKGIDEFIINFDEDGNIASIDHPFLRQSFSRNN